MTKAEIIREGTRLGVDFRSQSNAAIRMRAAALRAVSSLLRRGFAEAELPDPTHYRNETIVP